MNYNSDKELKQSAPDNSREVFDSIYNAYSGRIYNFVMKLTSGNTYLAEEITQMTFVKLWERRAEMRDYDDSLAYLFVTAKHILLNTLEHDMVERVYRDYVSINGSETDNTTEEAILYHFMMDAVMREVDTMPTMRRKVFLMSKFGNKSYTEIAAELGISTSTVEKHIIMALRFLRSVMKDRYDIFVLLVAAFVC
jgi:RNA polymerase sigma-70 factor (ECF subfamily)